MLIRINKPWLRFSALVPRGGDLTCALPPLLFAHLRLPENGQCWAATCRLLYAPAASLPRYHRLVSARSRSDRGLTLMATQSLSSVPLLLSPTLHLESLLDSAACVLHLRIAEMVGMMPSASLASLNLFAQDRPARRRPCLSTSSRRRR